MVWKLFSNFPSTKEGGKWVIQSKAFFIQLNWKVEFRHNGAQGEVKVLFLGICRLSSSCPDANKFVDIIYNISKFVRDRVIMKVYM